MATIAPITGMFRRRLIIDLSVGIGSGFAMANLWWYSYHLPRTNARDDLYTRLENERAAERNE